MRKRHTKPGYIGPAFYEWLEWLEYMECVTQTHKRPGKPVHVTMNDRLFHCETEEDFNEMMNQAAPVDAWLARCVRSSVKYKTTATTLADMVARYVDEMRYISNQYPVNLPHEWCTLVVEWDERDTYLFCLQETTTSTGERYEELDVEADEPWICVNMAFHRKSGVELMETGEIDRGERLSYCPVEFHFNKGKVLNEGAWVTANPKGMIITEAGTESLRTMEGIIISWVNSFHLASVLRHKSPGVAPLPQSFRPKKRRKKRQFPKFEHIVVELEVDEPDPSQTGRSMFQPHKRLHQVRGHLRHYKTGKTSWVKPHWRGDEALGVVKKDYEVVMHEDPQ